jgi:hypothetical protein
MQEANPSFCFYRRLTVIVQLNSTKTGDQHLLGSPGLPVVGATIPTAPACDRRDEQHLVAILKRIRSAAEEADVFFIHVRSSVDGR